jgi:hypothetical protein
MGVAFVKCPVLALEFEQEGFNLAQRPAFNGRANLGDEKDHANRVPKIQSERQRIRGSKKPNLAPASNAHRSVLLRKTYGMAVRGESRVTYHGNRSPGNDSGSRLAYSDPARELAHLLARGASIGRIAADHHFRRGQLLIGLVRTLRTVVRILEVAHPMREHHIRAP